MDPLLQDNEAEVEEEGGALTEFGFLQGGGGEEGWVSGRMLVCGEGIPFPGCRELP